jgi:cytochrome c
MIKLLLPLLTLVFFTACNEPANTKHLDGKKLLEQKCSKCHNLDLPPQTFKDEVAPPMMAVAFHIVGFTQVNIESQRIPKAIAFVKDYVVNPAASKSYCDKESLKSYGVMPSQKGKVTQDELEAIATYMFEHFTQKNLEIAQANINRLNAMPAGERIALKNNCLGCHKQHLKIVGPSFDSIAQRYKGKVSSIEKSIKNGSKGKWKDSHGALMPAFKNISDKDLKTLAEWISHGV